MKVPYEPGKGNRSRVARVSSVRRNPQEAIGKALTQRTGSAYKAGVLDKRAYRLKVRYLHRRHASRCDGHKCESESAISGETLKQITLRSQQKP